MINCVVN